MRKKIKLFDPITDKREQTAINQVLKSNFWASGSGSGKVSEFEKYFRKYINTKQCIALNSGTAALHLALSLFDIKNKEVILPSLSFVSTAHAVTYNDAKPVFVDIDPQTLCLDPHKIEQKITNKTKAILPVHFAGFPCNLDEIKKLCKKHKLFLIEDAAHAAGSKYKNKKIGSHGDAVCFSFHPVKNLAMPNGGAITLNTKDHQKQKIELNSKRWCGITSRKGSKYDVKEIGWNFYMNEFSAVIGIEQLKKLDKLNNKRKKIAKRYHNEIKLERKMPFDNNCSYHLYWILIKNRDKFMKSMQKNGIETGIHYFPIHKMKYYSSNTKLPTTENVGNHIVSLPIHPNLNMSDINKIIKLTNKFAN